MAKLLSAARHDWILAALLVLVTAIAYQPAWNGKPIWDDDAHITKPELRSLSGLTQIWTKPGATQQYYPAVHSVFWVEHKIWGDAVLPYHLVNILLHSCSALLLAKILQELKVSGAWLAAAIFALHPIQVESVAWISELKNVFSGFCYLASALVYLRFDRHRQWTLYAAAFVFFLVGLAAKSVIATLPAALLLIFWWKRGKLSWKHDVVPLLPFFVVGIAAGIFTAAMERSFIGAQGSEFNFTLVQRFLIAGRAFWFYLGKIFWPTNLTFVYPRWNISHAIWWQYLFPVTALFLFILFLVWRKRWRGSLLALLYFAGTLFPALGFFNVFPFRYSFVADHFQYLASIGPIVLAATGISALSDSLGQARPFLGKVLCGTLLLSLGVLAWRQCAMYADMETLWRTTVSRNSESWLAQNNLGDLLLQSGRSDEALTHLQRAVEINPGSFESHNNLGNVLLILGRKDESFTHLERALEINPNYGPAHNNLGLALEQVGKRDEAVVHYRRALEVTPHDARVYCNLGTALLQMGIVDEAIARLNKAIELNPDDAKAQGSLGAAFLRQGRASEAVAPLEKAVRSEPDAVEAQNNLGIALLQIERPDESLVHLQKALELDPNYAAAHYNIANTMLELGRAADSVDHLHKALALDPSDAAAHNNLAWILATWPDARIRNGIEAVKLADRANQLTNGQSPIMSATLAAAYAEAGRFPDAVGKAESALQLATVSGALTLAEKIRAQLELYRANQPFRDDRRTRARERYDGQSPVRR